MDLSSDADLSVCTDADDISPWAAEAFAWAVGSCLIQGVTAATPEPSATTSRAQAATILMRYTAG